MFNIIHVIISLDGDYMLLIHESNFKNKINSNYKGLGEVIEDFYQNEYLKTKMELLDIDFSKADEDNFKKATNIINAYYKKLDKFTSENNITSQSKFRSTFLEELSSYLFEDNEYIKNGILGIYNKGIYAGMKIGNDLKINIMKKDVDFCIGKKVKMKIENQEFEIILPIVAVEVKTYLDATMFGEVQYSSKLIKNATPNAKTYVLMETNQVGSDKIISARYDNVLNEMFVLRRNEQSLIEYSVLQDYYNEIISDIADIAVERDVITPGRLINVEK